MQLYTVFLMLA